MLFVQSLASVVLTEQHEQASESWCVRLLHQMVPLTTVSPRSDGSYTAGDTSWRELSQPDQSMCIFAQSTVWARHVALFEKNDNHVYQMMVCRKLAWWCQEERLRGKTKFGGAHPQRFNAWRWETCLERAYGCARLAHAEDPRVVGCNAVAQRLV